MQLSDNMGQVECVDCDNDKYAMRNTAYVVKNRDIL